MTATLAASNKTDAQLARRHLLQLGVALPAISTLAACGSMGSSHHPGSGWVSLVDGANLKNVSDLAGWTQLGKGNWSITEGTLEGKNGAMGYLMTPASYSDFELHAEFWADTPANSGIFLRCQDRNKVGSDNAYEVNIFDKRPDPSYGTAAIVDVAKVTAPYPQAANQWNTFHITAKGDQFTVIFNGQKTVDARDGKFKSGPIALQSFAGTIRFRKVLIRPL